ncbi:MAG: tRNA (adenosine(37)-N6)-threonylcarbamoyltransferase complex ATPase subunit type 1 TsaE [Candidatus Peregrinibacteria bacterium]|nr:tRNA (adenosine(37)-N6)-threonylcarbamoyltransferase complex ATPase subunit type 1 TsaE [Candidatus Peregrinibacteria bacterium]
MKTVFKTRSPEETIELGIQLAARLKPGQAVLLFGELGAGKTHFTKGIAKGLGIDEMIKSPTFTYVNQYDLEGNLRFYHYDLYRLNHGDEFFSIGLEDSLHNPHVINVIEWADRLAGLHPKEYVRVDFVGEVDHHEISFEFFDNGIAPEALVEKLWEDWTCPVHVRAHQKQVAKVALQIGRALNEKNILVDLNLLNTAALLHDMARVVDFLSLEKSKFDEEITDEKWSRWQDLRQQFKGMNHGDAAAGSLLEEGYNKTAEIIRLHRSTAILDEAEKFSLLEIAIVYYADKRVKHDEIVSLKERFHDGRERYGNHDNEEQKAIYLEVEKANEDLEKQLFSLINISPEDIK